MNFSQKDILKHKYSLNLQNFYFCSGIIKWKSKISNHYKFTKEDLIMKTWITPAALQEDFIANSAVSSCIKGTLECSYPGSSKTKGQYI